MCARSGQDGEPSPHIELFVSLEPVIERYVEPGLAAPAYAKRQGRLARIGETRRPKGPQNQGRQGKAGAARQRGGRGLLNYIALSLCGFLE